MFIAMILVFVVGYFFIAMEHPFKIDKAATALATGVAIWILLMFGKSTMLTEATPEHVDLLLGEHLSEIAQILFFLLGAMTIVELVDVHNGFGVITDRIKTKDRVKLLWIIGVVTFFLSAALDNMTTAIVMAALLRKLIKEQKELWSFGAIVVIAANAGGAWSPIGDVTTIMLWIGGQVTAGSIVTRIFIPSALNLIIPLLILTFTVKGTIESPVKAGVDLSAHHRVNKFEQQLIFWLGILGLLWVPIFKTVTHLPPFVGILLSLSVLWIVTEIMHRRNGLPGRESLMVSQVLRRVDTPTVLFFLGILLAVAGLQSGGQLTLAANWMDKTFGNIYIVNTLIGLLSAIIDNVPLVAAAMGMYPMTVYPQDHLFWELLAYCAGTGGSILIIGSAAGVAIMGILKIDFIWYMKKISLLALSGYLAGVISYYLMNIGHH
jgi:Na+/H+ antiporter NhaD/arsenite permease-like protein